MESSIADQLKIDQSVAHNGVCLTVVAIVTIVITIGMSVSSTIYLPAKVGFHVVLIYSNALDYYSLKLANAVVFMLLTVALSSVLVSKTENLSVS